MLVKFNIIGYNYSMAELLTNRALEAYHAADFVRDRWKIDRHGLGKVKFDLRFDPLETVINAGRLAASVGELHSGKVPAYEQDALLSVGRYLTDFCADGLNYKTEQAVSFVDKFREITGEDRANEAMLAGFFSRVLREQPRQVIIDGLESKNKARQAVIPDNPDELTKEQKLFFFNFAQFGLFANQRGFSRALTTALKREVTRREIGTETEQMKHLLMVNLGRTVIPLIVHTAALTAAAPSVGMFLWVLNGQLTHPEAITASPELVRTVDSLLFLKAAGWTVYANNIGIVKEQRNSLKYPLGAIWGNLRHLLTTGKAPGTPQV